MQQIQNGGLAVSDTTAPAPEAAADGHAPSDVAISIVIPVKDEEQSLGPLYEALTAQMGQLGEAYEIVFVDDGSRDGSFTVMRDLHRRDPHVIHVCLLCLRRPARSGYYTRGASGS